MSSETVRKRNDCRLCFSNKLELAIDLVPTPIGDAYLRPNHVALTQECFPMSLFLCMGCGHLQLIDIVDPSVLFRDYTYRTAHSPGLVEHFRNYAASTVKDLQMHEGDFVVELGSNDGSLLKAFSKLGMRVLGVDPAVSAASEANANGIETLPEFFDPELAKKILSTKRAAKLIAANNVYAHIDDLEGVTAGIAGLLAADGVFVFEVSYLPDVLDKKAFDTFYLEHLSHHSLIPLRTFFARHGLKIFDVQRNSNKGGSIRCFVERVDGPYQVKQTVQEMLDREIRNGILELSSYRRFARQIESQGEKLCEILDRYIQQGKRVVGFGASNPITTIIYQFGLGSRLSFLIDENAEKLGWKSPGFHLEVRGPDALKTDADVVVVLAWNYADAIMRRYDGFAKAGGVFVVPLPELKEV